MREIKFRMWDNGQMVYDTTTRERTLNGAIRCIVDDGYILMQFTGLHDSKGKEIYEGDILSDVFQGDEGVIISRETVFFDVTLGTWMLDHSAKQDGSVASTLASNLEDYEYTVIGNIHEKSSEK